jgi:DNA-binding SARP family transcriptional activator
MLHLRTFGGLCVTGESDTPLDVTIPQRRMLALLALVAAAGKSGISRERIIALLWPDGRSERGRGSLSQALYSARKALRCDELMVVVGETLRLNPAVIIADIALFEESITQGDFAQAARLYRGPFLDDFFIPGLLEFDAWVESHRRRIGEGAARVFDRLAADLERAGEWAAAAEWRQRQAATSPYDAVAAQRLATALRNAGDRTTALHRLQMHAALVRSDLEVEPDPSVLALIGELRERPPAAERISVSAQVSDSVAVAPNVAPRRTDSVSSHRRPALVIASVMAVLLALTFWKLGRQKPSVEVAPFSVAGAEPSLAFLREGLPQLIGARLDRNDGLAAGRGRTVLAGTVVGNSRRMIISASWPADRPGVASVAASAEGSLEELSQIADRLAGRLLVADAEETDRFPKGMPRSLSALRSYLVGQEQYRRGAFVSAIQSYQRAVAQDSTFALAALQLAVVTDRLNGMNQDHQGLTIAWMHRDQLNAADVSRLIAFAGPAYPALSRRSEQRAATNVALRASANRPELLLELAQRVARTRNLLGISDSGSRPQALFARVISIDSANRDARGMLALLDRQNSEPAGLFVADSRSFPAHIQWRLQAQPDAPPFSRDRFSELDDESLVAITRLSLYDAFDVEAGAEAARIREQRAKRSRERGDAILALHAIALNAGRPQRALQLTRQLAEALPGSQAYLRLRVMDALYGRGDSMAGDAAARRLSALLGAKSGVSAEEGRFANLCTVGQWQLAHENASGIASIIDELRSAPTTRTSLSVSTAPAACAEMLSAWRSVVTEAPDAPAQVARLDSFVLVGPAAGDASAYAPILIARLFERIGRPDQALAAIQRRPYLYGWPRYLTTQLRKEGRLAALAGNHRASSAAYRQYLALRHSPDPEAADEVALIRAEAEGVGGARAWSKPPSAR